VLRALAVFAGGATVEAAQSITGADLDTLDGLVAKNMLVRRHAHPVSRLGMLETIRAYAAERFAATGDGQAVRERHWRYYLALAQEYGTEQALLGAGRQAHLARLDADIDNLHAALAHAVRQACAEPALVMCVALGRYWRMRGRFADAVEWIDAALNMPGGDAHAALRVRALCIKATALWPLGRGVEQPAILAEAEATARVLADPLGWTKSATCITSQTSSRPRPMGRYVWAVIATPRSTSPAQHRPRARSTIPSSGCSCRGTPDWRRS
jgi:hypothetical protein